jgi:hypothetical protein
MEAGLKQSRNTDRNAMAERNMRGLYRRRLVHLTYICPIPLPKTQAYASAKDY